VYSHFVVQEVTGIVKHGLFLIPE